MPPGDDIQRFLTGAWRLMTGKPDGVRLLDISADGFWNSFFAIVVAAPVLIVGWVSAVNSLIGAPEELAGRIGLLLRFGIIDLFTWIVPLVILAIVARPIGVADRFIHYVVASNWGSVISAWISLPALLAAMLLGSSHAATATIGVALFFVNLVLTWRLTNAVLNRGAPVATAVFTTILVVSFAMLFAMRSLLLGIELPQPSG